MFSSYSGELWRFAAVLVAGLLLGWAVDNVAAGLFVVTLGLAIWQLRQLRRYLWWVEKGDWSNAPSVSGMWGDVYTHFYRMVQRNRRRKRMLLDIVNRFRESALALPDATVTLNEDGGIVWWNEMARRLFGLKSGHDVGQRIDNLLRHPTFTHYYQNADFQEAVEIPSPVHPQITLSVRVIRYGNKELLLVGQDVTRLHRLEQTRQDFVANVSHELRTPLTVVGGYVETLLDSELGRDPRWQRSLEQMSQQTSRMTAIVDDLLYLTKLETQAVPVRKTAVNVAALLHSVHSEAEVLKKPGSAQFKFSVQADEQVWLLGDEAELHSALSNIVVNAIRYSPKGGEIVLSWYRDEEGGKLSVSDQGIGIPAADIPRLTERFYRVDNSRSRHSGGTGLGLSIVKHVLVHHDATLSVRSEVNKGSTFTCVFPSDRLCAPMNRTDSSLSPV